MKKFVILFILLSTRLLHAQAQVTKSQQAVQFSVIKMFEALSNRDSVGLKNYCTADIVLYEYGNVWNADTLILKAITLNQSVDFKRINRFDFINTTIHKKTAWTTYNLQSEITRNDKHELVQWMETVILVKHRKQWKIKVLHSTLFKRT